MSDKQWPNYGWSTGDPLPGALPRPATVQPASPAEEVERLAGLLHKLHDMLPRQVCIISERMQNGSLAHGVGFVDPAGETPSEAECERIYEACRVPFREVEYDVYPTPAVGRHALIRAILRAAREATP